MKGKKDMNLLCFHIWKNISEEILESYRLDSFIGPFLLPIKMNRVAISQQCLKCGKIRIIETRRRADSQIVISTGTINPCGDVNPDVDEVEKYDPKQSSEDSVQEENLQEKYSAKENIFATCDRNESDNAEIPGGNAPGGDDIAGEDVDGDNRRKI